MKLERIVLGIDFSPGSLEAARWTARHFAPDAELVLTHLIILPERPPIMRSRYPRRDLLATTLREGAEKRLRDLGQSLFSDRMMWIEIREGASGDALAKVATDYAANLIVVGAHGERTGLAGGLGSTARDVVRIADVPVLLVSRPAAAPIARILVPVDDVPVTQDVLRWAGVLSRRLGAKVTLLHVTEATLMSHALAAAAVVSGTPAVKRGRRRDRQGPGDRWVEVATSSGVPREQVTSEEAFGLPAVEILAASDRLEADLIVMGRRAAGPLRRAVLGSVTERVLGSTDRNVLVVPEPRAVQAEER